MDTKSTTTPAAINLNKPAYIVFVLVGIVFLILKDFSQAVIFWGLALVFDPFDIKLAFDKRPLYQKVWLIVHLAVTLSLFVFEIVTAVKK